MHVYEPISGKNTIATCTQGYACGYSRRQNGQHLTGCAYIHFSKSSNSIVSNPHLTTLSSPLLCPLSSFTGKCVIFIIILSPDLTTCMILEAPILVANCTGLMLSYSHHCQQHISHLIVKVLNFLPRVNVELCCYSEISFDASCWNAGGPSIHERVWGNIGQWLVCDTMEAVWFP